MPEIICNPETHEYRVDSIIKPGVTEILQAEGLMDLSMVQQSVLDDATEFGHAIHTTTEYYDKEKLDFLSLDLGLEPWLQGWIKFRRDTGFVPEGIEVPIYSARWGFCGTLDRYGRFTKMPGQPRGLVDVKSSTAMYPATEIQTALYQIGLFEYHGIKTTKRVGVQLLENDYKIKWYDKPSDESIAISAVQLYNWKIENKIKKRRDRTNGFQN